MISPIEKKSAKPCKTGVILVYGISRVIILLPVEFQYFNNRNTNKHKILHVYVFYCWHVHNVVIFSLTLLLLVLLIDLITFIIIQTINALPIKRPW